MNKFLKKNLQINEKDKKFLMVLLAFVILAVAYFVGYQNLNDMKQKYEQQTSVLKLKQKDLVDKNSHKAKYLEDTVNYKNISDLILSNYASGINQDDSINFINKVQLITGTWIKSSTLSDSSMIYSFGNVNSSNPSSSGLKVYSTDMKGYRTTLTLTYEAKYDQWKKLITYVNSYFSKNTIDSISMTYNEVTGIVSGTLTVSTYAITGSQRKYIAPKFDLPTGTSNIYSSSIFSSKAIDLIDQNGEYILSDYDGFIFLNASTSDVDSCIVGKKAEGTNNSILSKNSNDTEDVTIRVAGTKDNYTIQYKIGNKTYPATNYDKGDKIIPGNTLDVLIMSSSRVSSSDKSGIKLNLVNETDMTLNVKLCNDDTQSPRVKFEGKTGSVNIYK